MRGLTILVVGDDVGRYRAALSLAAAQAAAGGAARLFMAERAVALLAGAPAEDDAACMAAGLPGLRALEQEALGLGVRLIACQTGTALAGVSLAGLDERIEAGGTIGIVAGLGEDQLLAI